MTFHKENILSQILKRKYLIIITLITLIGGYLLFFYGKSHKIDIATTMLSTFEKVSKLLPIEPDTQKEIEVANTLTQTFTQKDGKTHVFLVLLQNNFELRPGGGFLGQYAVIKVKDGTVVSHVIEDANLLDQRITVKVTPPWPLTRYAQIKRWKFRDSNFSPDFPTNAEKAQYFYRLSGGREAFDGVIAVNATVFDHLLAITGPITIPGYHGIYTADGGALQLEEAVEKAYLGDDVPLEAKQARKNIMKKIGAEMITRLTTIDNIPKIASIFQEELRDKNIMVFFKEPSLQSLVASVHWDGSVTKDWNHDSLMIVDANLGALKSDYFVKRSLEYSVDFTTGTRATATIAYTYNHTATYGDWRTSDYHTYTRVYTPKGSTYVENSRQKTGGVASQDDEAFNRTVFGYKVDAIMNQSLPTKISYLLPESITENNYKLLLQKQSGIGNIPVTIRVKTSKGELEQTLELKKDLELAIQEIEEKK